MKVQIEKPLFDLDEMPILMMIINQALLKSSLGKDPFDDLVFELDVILPKTTLKYGRGGNHVWVNYRNERILLITE
jgi:hypothetical protein